MEKINIPAMVFPLMMKQLPLLIFQCCPSLVVVFAADSPGWYAALSYSRGQCSPELLGVKGWFPNRLSLRRL